MCIKKYIVCVILVMVSTVLNAAPFESILKMGASAEMVANGSVMGWSKTAAGVFENPASLTRTKSGSVSLFTTALMNEVTYQNMGVSVLMPFGVLAAGYMEATVPNIPHTGVTNQNEFYVKEWFDYKDSLMRLGYQFQPLTQWSIGFVATGYNRTAYKVSGSAFSFDIGSLWTENDWEASVLARNVITSQGGMKTTFDNGTTRYEAMPLESVVGVRWVFGKWGSIGGQYEMSSTSTWASFFSVNPLASPVLSIHAGLKQIPQLQSIRTGYTLGVSVELLTLSAQYAFETIPDHPEMTAQHYVSVAFEF